MMPLERLQLPPTDRYQEFVSEFIRRKQVAEWQIGGNEFQIARGEGTLEWIGEAHWPIVIGVPNIRQVKQYDHSGQTLLRVDVVMTDPGFGLIELFFSPEHHGFFCVRKDQYEKA